MHANIDTWWSKVTMAYFWGMYVNGIAVYGRDSLLTCDYANFMMKDQQCPMENNDNILLLLMPNFFLDDNTHPSDWRNCSSKGYHP
jgi:hypothetical protein